MRHFTIVFLCLLPILGLRAQVVINEFSAANVNTIADNYNKYEDWIELQNNSPVAVNLGGFFLSDRINNPTKWAFPAGVLIPAGGRLLVFASGRPLSQFAGQLHANFKISQTKGEYVVLTNPAGVVLDSYHITKPNQTNHSWGRHPSTGQWRVYTTPTPGAANGATTTYQEYAPKPIFSKPAGFYSGSQTISLFAPVGSTIRYTLNGDEPTAVSPIYTGPITLDATTVIRARIFSNNPELLPGFVETNTYFIDETHTVPVISVAGTQLNTLLTGTQIEPIGSLEFFKDGQLIDEGVGQFNKHGNDSWAYQQRGIDYITRDQYGYAAEVKDQIFHNKSRDEYQRFMFKAAANDNYPFQNGGAHIRDAYVHLLSQRAGLELDERSYEPCILYLNGAYWGVYEIREKVDDPDFTDYYYDQDEYDIDFIKTWGGTWQEYGTWNDWYPLHNFITTNNMADPANYDYAAENLDVLSLVDYMIINTHTVCKDWLNWNTAWWRGRNPDGDKLKWRYAMWDLDATFGHYVNYTSIPNTTPSADPCDNEIYPPGSDPQGHVKLITSLMANDQFHSLYVNRYADLLNSYLSCDYMIALLDSMIARIEPEMPRHIAKWGGSMAQWQNNVQNLRNFINARCTFIDNGIVDCYDVDGPFPLTVTVLPADTPNKVRVNTFVPGAFPFNGDYFGGTTLEFQALADPDWKFFKWEVVNQSFSPNPTSETINMNIVQGDHIIAYFVPAVPCALPGNIQISTTQTTATVTWDDIFNALSYEVRWRKVGDPDWTVISYVGDEITLSGLTPCTDYELEIGTICGTATSGLIDDAFSTACLNAAEERPVSILAMQVSPNPFSGEAWLEFELAEGGPVRISAHSAAGAEVAQIAGGELAPGPHRFALNGGDWPAGIYFVQLRKGNEVAVAKVIKQ